MRQPARAGSPTHGMSITFIVRRALCLTCIMSVTWFVAHEFWGRFVLYGGSALHLKRGYTHHAHAMSFAHNLVRTVIFSEVGFGIQCTCCISGIALCFLSCRYENALHTACYFPSLAGPVFVSDHGSFRLMIDRVTFFVWV